MAQLRTLHGNLVEMARITLSLFAKAWSDENFQNELLDNPEPHFTAAFEAADFELPESFTIEIGPCYERWLLTPVGDGMTLFVPFSKTKPEWYDDIVSAMDDTELADLLNNPLTNNQLQNYLNLNPSMDTRPDADAPPVGNDFNKVEGCEDE